MIWRGGVFLCRGGSRPLSVCYWEEVTVRAFTGSVMTGGKVVGPICFFFLSCVYMCMYMFLCVYVCSLFIILLSSFFHHHHLLHVDGIYSSSL
ncbi:proteasome alpha 7 subunit, putative, partial [Trypanosoma cruzi marinkellei]